jgi:hypothetical protein
MPTWAGGSAAVWSAKRCTGGNLERLPSLGQVFVDGKLVLGGLRVYGPPRGCFLDSATANAATGVARHVRYARPRRIGERQRIVKHVRVRVQRLRVAQVAAHRVGREEAAEVSAFPAVGSCVTSSSPRSGTPPDALRTSQGFSWALANQKRACRFVTPTKAP